MDRLPPLRLLATFDEVARRGSMRDAAARLNVTQPAVTQAIKALEDHVGLALLDRRTRPARLTEAGGELARAIRNGMETIAEAIEDLQARSRRHDRQLTASCTLGMATHWLMPRLHEFYALRPDIAVNVQAPPQEAPSVAPGIDLALRYGAGPWRDGTTWRLFEERIRPVGRADLIDRLRAAGTTLSAAPLIEVRGGAPRRWEGWRDYLKTSGGGAATGPAQFFDNYVQAVQAALDGRGLVLGWRSITGALERDGALVGWPGAADVVGMPYSVTVAVEAEGRSEVAAFLEWILETAAAEPLADSAPALR